MSKIVDLAAYRERRPKPAPQPIILTLTLEEVATIICGLKKMRRMYGEGHPDTWRHERAENAWKAVFRDIDARCPPECFKETILPDIRRWHEPPLAGLSRSKGRKVKTASQTRRHRLDGTTGRG